MSLLLRLNRYLLKGLETIHLVRKLHFEKIFEIFFYFQKLFTMNENCSLALIILYISIFHKYLLYISLLAGER